MRKLTKLVQTGKKEVNNRLIWKEAREREIEIDYPALVRQEL